MADMTEANSCLFAKDIYQILRARFFVVGSYEHFKIVLLCCDVFL